MSRIAKASITEFTFDVPNLGRDSGFNRAAAPGETARISSFVLRIETEDGAVGEYIPAHSSKNPAVVGQVVALLPMLIGRNAFEREGLYQDLRRFHRHLGGVGHSAIDVALWDLAGKATGQSIARLLGGHRTRLPTYASTQHGDRNGVLSTPAAYADFAQRCLDLGYKGFKIHGWCDSTPREEAENVLAVARAVAGKMALMIDPCSELHTFADALYVGQACDEAGYFWYEDPMRDCGWAPYVHRQLRERIRTPLLLTEHVRGLEPKLPWLQERATDFLRADPEYDGGITGVMKTAHLAEAFGVDIELHAAGPAQRHCMAAIRNSNFYEMSLISPMVGNPIPPIYTCGYSDQLEAVAADGTFAVPTGPGLGVSYDWDFINHNTTARHEVGSDAGAAQ